MAGGLHESGMTQSYGTVGSAFSLLTFLANHTMDIEDSWARSLTWPFPGMCISSCNLVAHSDGGLRKSTGAAVSAWIVECGCLVDGAWKFHPLAMGGTFASGVVSLEGLQ